MLDTLSENSTTHVVLYRQGKMMKDYHIDALSVILKSMAHPIRLKILCLLQDKEMSVGDLHRELETTVANVSQHLTILRDEGILDYRKEASTIYNYIRDKRMVALMMNMRSLFCQEPSELN